MLGKIIYISDNEAHIELSENIIVNDLINMHVIFEEENKKIVGEIQDINKNIIKIKYLGEFIDNKFMGGVIRKPSINSNVRMLTEEELVRAYISPMGCLKLKKGSGISKQILFVAAARTLQIPSRYCAENEKAEYWNGNGFQAV